MAPVIDLFYNLEPARVIKHTAEFAEPGTHAVGNSIEHPNANFGIALHAVFPAIRFFQTNTEQSGNRFAPHRSSVFLCILSVQPGSGQTSSGLTICSQQGRQLTDLPHVERTQSAAASVGHDTSIRIDLAHLAVPKLPEIKQALLPPFHIGPPSGIVR